MLLSMLLSGLAFNFNSGASAIVGMLLAIVWLAMLVLIALPQTDRLLAGMHHRLKLLSMALMMILILAGVVEFGMLFAVSTGVMPNSILGEQASGLLKFVPGDISYSDSDALLYQAVDNLLHGKDPYSNANVVTALQMLKLPPGRLTPLRVGPLADVTHYPDQAQFAEIWQDALQSPTLSSPAIESSLGYPAGFFLIPAFFMWLGIDNLRWILLIITLPALAYIVAICRPGMRLWMIGTFLGSLVIWNSIVRGLTGALYFPFLLLAWVLWRRNLWLSALFMGVAVATKQLAWFFVPFYLILIWKNLNFSQVLKAAGVVGGVFLAFNLPFIVSNPSVWLNSLISLIKDPFFPSGTGPVVLVIYGYLRFDSPLGFLILEAGAMLAGCVWYWHNARRFPSVGVVLSALPLFFAYRSSWVYFFYVDVIVLARVIINEYPRKITVLT